jgi:phage terminase small subunit
MAPLKNPRHDAFCREIAGGHSVAGAWVAVGFNAKARNAARLARQPKIVARIAELRDEFNEGAEIKLRYLQEKLLALVTSDVTQFFEQNKCGALKPCDLTQLPPELRSAIAEVRVDGKGKVTIKLVDKLHALDSLIKTIGGFAPIKIAATNPDGARPVVPIINPCLSGFYPHPQHVGCRLAPE